MTEETTKLHDFIETLTGKFVDICTMLAEEKAKVKRLEEEIKKLTYELSTRCDCPCDKH